MLDASLIALLLTLGGVWFWLDSLKVRDLARASATETCRRQQLQLLDATVSLGRLKIGRNSRGRVVLMRVFTFDYSQDGVSRQQGFVVVIGHRVETVGLQAQS